MGKASVADRWHLSRPQKDAAPCTCDRGDKVASADHGCAMRWQLRWRDDDNRQRARNYDKKGHADSEANRMNGDAEKGVYRDPDAGRQTFRTYTEGTWFPSQTFGLSSRERIASALRNAVYPVFGSMAFANIKPTTIKKWVAGMTCAVGTKSRIFDHVSAIFAAAVDDDIITKNPCKASTVKRPRAPKRSAEKRTWTGETVRAVRDALPDPYKATVDAMAGLGVRQGEVFALAVDDIDARTWARKSVDPHVLVRRKITKVGGRHVFAPLKSKEDGDERRVPLRPAVLESLRRHLDEYPAQDVILPWEVPDGDPVTFRLIFTAPSGGALWPEIFNERAWKPALRLVGLPCDDNRKDGNGCHVCRHTFASTLLANGVPLPDVSAYLGHADSATTLKYYAHAIPRVAGSGEITWAGLKAIDMLLLGDASSAPKVHSEGSPDA